MNPEQDTIPTTTMQDAPITRLLQNMERVIKGKRLQLEHVLTCLLAGGHILMEDYPGTGKTILARSLAQSISGEEAGQEIIFKRVQFTPDLLPMDLLGTHIYDERSHDFVFKKGPLFCNILLADEINRASPKVQSALLESMAEQQITMGEKTYQLSDLFFTIATQNPIDLEGTYPLPAAQLDRFFMKISFGYVDADTELEIYRDYLHIAENLQHLKRVVSKQELLGLKVQASNVFLHEELVKSVSNLVRQTRESTDVAVGASTRSGIAFLRCLKAYALVKGRDYATEDDVIALAKPVLDHRLVYRNKDGKQRHLDQLISKENERLLRLKLF